MANGSARAARYALVATDLDGTLVRGDGTVSPRTRSALELVERAGATLVFATGRPPRWLPGLVEATGHRGLAVCSNGALVYDLASETVVEQYLLEPEVGRAACVALREGIDGVTFAVERDDRLFHEPGYVAAEADRTGASVQVGRSEELWSGPLVKLLARHVDRSADDLLEMARTVLGETVEVTHSNGHGLIEICATGVSKASTLAAVCERRGIDREAVVAFGDMPNDLPMLGWAGTSYAVANAHPRVRAAADQVCPANDDDGVAVTLERLFG